MTQPGTVSNQIEIRLEGGVLLHADRSNANPDPIGIVVFAHGSGSSRHSPRNKHVAEILQHAGLETLLLDLLTPEEDETDRVTREHRFDIPLLADRVIGAIDWIGQEDRETPLGLFGASTGAAAALIAAAKRPERVDAVVSRGGRPDLAKDSLPDVEAPTLLIVGSRDSEVLDMNRSAQSRITSETSLEVVAGATHLFEEPGALDKVAHTAAVWFKDHMA